MFGMLRNAKIISRVVKKFDYFKNISIFFFITRFQGEDFKNNQTILFGPIGSKRTSPLRKRK